MRVRSTKLRLRFVAALALTLALLALVAIGGQSRPPRQPGQSGPQPPPKLAPRANPKARAPISETARSEGRKAVAAVGQILVRNAGQGGAVTEARPRGSGVIIRRDGLVVTNYHVVAQDKVDRLFDEIYLALTNNPTPTTGVRRYRLRGLLLNRAQDLALLRIVADGDGKPYGQATNFFALEFGDARRAQIFEDLMIIGYPEKGGSTVTASTGVVQGTDFAGHWIKTDAQLIRGNSGGAAVNSAGKLIGIPTKVVLDTVPVDKDGDGFPDGEKEIGAVGFLRPAYLVAAMVRQLDSGDRAATASPSDAPNTGTPPVKQMSPPQSLKVEGVVRAVGGRAIAGANIGLLLLGAKEVSESTLLAWGGSNAEGRFALNKPVPAGRYTLKIKAVGYEPLLRDIEVTPTAAPLLIELRASR